MSELQMPTGPILHGDPLGGAALLRRITPAGADAVKAEKTAKDFESILLYRLIEEMRRTIPKSGLLETGASGQMESLFWFYLAQEVAEKGGVGLWKDLSRTIGLAGQKAPVPPASGPKA